MQTSERRTEVESLERAFWQSLVDNDPKVASGMLTPTALMVSANGAMSFDPITYEKMAVDSPYRLVDYSFSDMDIMFPTDDIAIATYRARQKVEMDGKTTEQDVVDSSTWIRIDGAWRCAAHTETEAKPV